MIERFFVCLLSLLALNLNGLSQDKKGFALLELFTSEDCSSCPPADDLLNSLIGKNEKDGNFFALAFHVDYWNDGGWKDPFSDAAYTARQQKYTDAFGLDAMYTPQMIVNGKEQTVGSDDSKINGFVKNALSKPASVVIDSLTAALDSAGKVEARCSISTPIKEVTNLHFALVEKHLTSDVAGGENAGKKLSHENVVRGFKTVTLRGAAARGGAEFLLPAGTQPKTCLIIAYLQNPGTMEVLGAAETSISPTK